MNTIRTFASTLLSMSLLMGVAFALGCMIGYDHGKSSGQSVTQRDTIIVTDTVVYNHFETDTVIRTEKVPYLVAVHDTLVDSVWVELPMERHHCHIQDTADIWYSGFDARLDSMIFYCPTTVIKEPCGEKTAERSNTVSLMGGTDEVSATYTRRFGNFIVGGNAGYRYDRTPVARLVLGYAF